MRHILYVYCIRVKVLNADLKLVNCLEEFED
jgi:hypothetical protein